MNHRKVREFCRRAWEIEEDNYFFILIDPETKT